MLPLIVNTIKGSLDYLLFIEACFTRRMYNAAAEWQAEISALIRDLSIACPLERRVRRARLTDRHR
jgi:hypothetical protein